MSLSAGTRLGPYEVVSALGAGGMGEVYRARDPRLGRDVALKILPDTLAADPERLARFTREAQALASLNHANIGAIFGLEGTALVLELIEGPTLADRIAEASHGGTRGLPQAEAMSIAKQIAAALEAAHESGLIHRDLKPANIKIRPDGSVKVLDFGLAKFLDAGRPPSGTASDLTGHRPDVTASPTLMSPTMMTGVGMILGTATYMSPEQARGKEVDARADIWAFGCVLYEMLTGTRAFPGDDITETIAAVVKTEPDWSALPADLPPTVLVYLRRCLAKPVRERVRSIADVRLALEGAFDVAVPAGTGPARPGQATSVRMGALAAFSVVALIAGATIAWLAKPVPPAAPAALRRFFVSAGRTPLAIATTNRDLAITADGKGLVYFAGQGGGRRLHLRPLDSLVSVPLYDADRAFEPFTSPDGKWIAFNDETDFQLRKIATTGGSPITITRVGREILGGTWGPDDTIVFANNQSGMGLSRVPAAGGTPTPLTTPDKARGEIFHAWPEFLPGGKALVYTIRSGKNAGEFELAGLDLQSNRSTRLGLQGSSPRFSPTGHLVYAVGTTLRAVRFDPVALKVLGEPVPVAEGVLTKAAGGSSFVISNDGILAYATATISGGVGRRLMLADRKGGREAIKSLPRAYTIPRLSPDGRRAAIDIRDQQGDIWIWDFERETLTRLTFDPASDQIPVWTPDGTRIAFASTRTGIANMYWQSADGTGVAEPLRESANSNTPLSFTPDGSRLLYRTEGGPGGEDVHMLRLDGTRESTPLLTGTFNERNAEVSPDGRWLAYQSNESGVYRIYVRPFPAIDSGRWQVSSGGGITPAWAGRELFFMGSDGSLMSATVAPGAAFSASKASNLTLPGGFVAAPTARSYDVSADGARFLLVDAATASGPGEEIVVVVNWAQELQRLLPR